MKNLYLWENSIRDNDKQEQKDIERLISLKTWRLYYNPIKDIIRFKLRMDLYKNN